MADAAAQSTTERGKGKKLDRGQTHTALARLSQEEDTQAVRPAEQPVHAISMGKIKRPGKPDVVQDAISRLGATAEAYGQNDGKLQK